MKANKWSSILIDSNKIYYVEFHLKVKLEDGNELILSRIQKTAAPVRLKILGKLFWFCQFSLYWLCIPPCVSAENACFFSSSNTLHLKSSIK